MAQLTDLDKDIISALKQGDKERAQVLRSLKAALKNEMIAARVSELTEEIGLAVLKREIKKRKEALDIYQKEGREDLASQERFELEVLQEYMPSLLSQEEIEQIIEKVYSDLPEENRNFGQVMKGVMAEVKGRADGKVVAELVKKKLP